MNAHQSLETPAKTTPKDFFLWLLVMVTLYLSAISLVILFFEYINILFPDPLTGYYDRYSSAIRFAMANLIVVFPLYIYLTRVVNQIGRRYPEKRELWVRKWIIFFSLFVGTITLIIDLIVLINKFLGGDLTTPFLLKVLAVVLIIGGPLVYYYQDLKGYWQTHEAQSKIVGGSVLVVVLASIIAGFFIMGSPTEQRLLRFDQQKTSDLQSIQWEILNYYQSTGAVPDELSELENEFSYFTLPADPQTDESYEYRKEGDLSFELCATFNNKSVTSRNEPQVRYKYGYDNANWEHEAGDVCFERTINPELYPVREEVL